MVLIDFRLLVFLSSYLWTNFKVTRRGLHTNILINAKLNNIQVHFLHRSFIIIRSKGDMWNNAAEQHVKVKVFTSRWPPATARAIQEAPCAVLRDRPAFWRDNKRTTSICPKRLAWWIGIQPTALVSSTEAPRPSRKRTASVLPWAHAYCRQTLRWGRELKIILNWTEKSNYGNVESLDEV